MRNPRAWIGIAVSALFLALLLRQVDPGELRAAVSDMRYEWLLAALVVEMIALWVRGLRWRLVLADTSKISRWDSFSLLMIGYAANNILPMRAGEVVRAHLLGTRNGTSRLAALGTIFVERIFDGVTLAIFLAGTIAVAGGNDALRALAGLMAAGFVFALLVLALLALQPRTADLLLALLGVLPEGIRPRARAFLGSFLAGLGALRTAQAWLSVGALSFLTWLLEATLYWFVGMGFGLDLHPLLYLAVCGAANLAIAVPSTAGGIGPYEYFAKQVVVLFGASEAAGTAYALVLHAVVIVPVVVIGALLLWQQGLGFSTLTRTTEARAERGTR